MGHSRMFNVTNRDGSVQGVSLMVGRCHIPNESSVREAGNCRSTEDRYSRAGCFLRPKHVSDVGRGTPRVMLPPRPIEK